ncbi:MAG TPA: hypothetical protein VKU77_27320 [Streptosporangiaceae bacterium]|nr:hypothetical protein [Streptosporangiaceae bacterium]
MRLPGAAVTAALCGHWDHQPPYPLAPHQAGAEEHDGELRARILLAAEQDTEAQVRQLIDQALSGQLKFPDGFTTSWRLRASRPAEVSAEEIGFAERLTRS